MTRPRRDVEPRRNPSVLDLDPVAIAVEISQLPPNHAHVVAAKAAAEVSELRHDRKVALRDAAKDIAGDRVWQGYADRRIPHEVVEARRAEPGPLAQVPAQRSPAKERWLMPSAASSGWSGVWECLQPDSAAAAVAEARRACRDAGNAREEEDRAAELNRWAAAGRTDVDVGVEVRDRV